MLIFLSFIWFLSAVKRVAGVPPQLHRQSLRDQSNAMLAADKSALNPRFTPVLCLFLILDFYSLLIPAQKNASYSSCFD